MSVVRNSNNASWRIEFNPVNAHRLTDREKEVMALIMNGYTSEEAARLLGISRRTVEFHRMRVQRRFNARNGTHLAYLISTEQPAVASETFAFL
jgi:DNA-binding CsgD family transcriptional regulator